jgi:ribosomal protein S18 acetylase RimI-like enzyme
MGQLSYIMDHSNPAEPAGPGPAAVCLRPERLGDEPFLLELYASTRQEELALTGWDEPARHAFLDMQFAAMRSGYAAHYPQAEFSIIALGRCPIGRIVIDQAAKEIRVVDIALLPAYRNQGVGTVLMRQVCAQAAGVGKPVRLSVLKNSRAVRWYERLGFARTDGDGLYEQMQWLGEHRSSSGSTAGHLPPGG